MRIPTQEQVKDWIWSQKAKNGYVYEDFARDVGKNVQTVRGWMQETNRKEMSQSALLAAARVMRDRERAESQISRSSGDLSPDQWRHAAEVAQDQGMLLWEYIGSIIRERIDVEDSLKQLEDRGIELVPKAKNLKMLAKIKDDEARAEDDDLQGAWLQGYAQALRDVARAL